METALEPGALAQLLVLRRAWAIWDNCPDLPQFSPAQSNELIELRREFRRARLQAVGAECLCGKARAEDGRRELMEVRNV